MPKEKTGYKIIPVNTASSNASISAKILEDAKTAGSKYMLIQIYESNEKIIFHSNSKQECEQKEKDLINDEDLNKMQNEIDPGLIIYKDWEASEEKSQPHRFYKDSSGNLYKRYKNDDGYYKLDPNSTSAYNDKDKIKFK